MANKTYNFEINHLVYGYEGEYFKPTSYELTEAEAVPMIQNAGAYAKVQPNRYGYYKLYAIWFKNSCNSNEVSQIFLTPKYIDHDTFSNLLYKYPTALIYCI